MGESVTIKSKISKLLNQMNENIFEQEDAIKMVLLTSLAGENVLLLGPAGVAKSMIASRLKNAFRNSKKFEYLMTRFSTPDEVFGPVSIKGIQEDRFERKTDGYLPSSNVVFMDEIFKSSPAIMNSLLTVMNERIYRNGTENIKVNITGMIAASNELAQESGLEAFSDRLLTKLLIKPIQNESNFIDFLKTNQKQFDNVDLENKITVEEIDNIRENSSKVAISKDAEDFILNIWKITNQWVEADENDKNRYYFSPRRWKKAINVLQTSAYLNDKNQIELMDCILLRHMLWNTAEDIDKIKDEIEINLKNIHKNHNLNIGDISKKITSLTRNMQDQGISVNKGKQIKNKDDELKFKNDDGDLWISTKNIKKIKDNDVETVKKYEVIFFNEELYSTQIVHDSIRLKQNHILPIEQINELKDISEVDYYSECKPIFEDTTIDNKNKDLDIHHAILRDWRDQLHEIKSMTDSKMMERSKLLLELEGQITDHLFVTEEEAKPLKNGLAMAEIELKNKSDLISKIDEYLNPVEK